MAPERYSEILRRIDHYNRHPKEGHISPFMARFNGCLSTVADKISVPTAELEEFLEQAEKDLPQDHLFG